MDVKKIMIVDDQEDIIEALVLSMQRKGWEVVTAKDGAEAKRKFLGQPVRLVLSDIRMPNKDGITLMQELKKEENPPLVILMTGFSEILETKSAFDLGADGFLAKPFRSKELFEEIEKILKRTDSSQAEQSLDANFVGIEVDKFISGSKMEHPIYLRFSAYKFIKIAHKGEDLPLDKIKQYRSKGLDKLYLLKSDYEKYIELTKKLMEVVATQHKKMEAGKTATIVEKATSIILQNIFTDSIQKEHFEAAQEVMGSTLQMVNEDEQMLTMIETVSKSYNELYAHSLCVSMFSVLLAKKVEWTSEKSIRLVSMGGLFHDVGKKLLPKNIVNKRLMELTYEEKKELERHPILGAEMLSQMDKIPEEVIQIALQHHENCLGTGFPNKLPKLRIHPFAKVVAIANEFMTIVQNERMKMKADNTQIFREALRKMILLKGGVFEPEYLQQFVLSFDFGKQLLNEITVENWGNG